MLNIEKLPLSAKATGVWCSAPENYPQRQKTTLSAEPLEYGTERQKLPLNVTSIDNTL